MDRSVLRESFDAVSVGGAEGGGAAARGPASMAPDAPAVGGLPVAGRYPIVLGCPCPNAAIRHPASSSLNCRCW
jgi:hypothetical protein